MDLEGLGPGDVLADKFRLDLLLGRGGMGSVWRAHHLTLNSPIALKLIDLSLAVHPDARSRFMREAQAAAALRSPHVVQTFDFGLHGDIPYIAMELLEGETLADRLDREKVISPALTAHVMTHVARAMNKAHDAGIVHRDLKPDNVFLVHNEDEEIAKVLDFGVAKATGVTSLATDSKTRTGALLGTPYYMSPEQAQGDKTVDWRTDLWAMAIITYECLLGHRPFDSDGLGNLLVQICVAPVPVPSQKGPVPPEFDAWFARATQRDPAQRFQSAREQVQALRIALGSDRSSQISSPAFDPTGKPIDAGSYPGIDVPGEAGASGGSQPEIDASRQTDAANPMNTKTGSSGGAAVVATSAPGRLSTGSVAATELDGEPVTIPKKSYAGLVVGLLVVLLLIAGGAVLALNQTATFATPDSAGEVTSAAEAESAAVSEPAEASPEQVIVPVESSAVAPAPSASVAPPAPTRRVAGPLPQPPRNESPPRAPATAVASPVAPKPTATRQPSRAPARPRDRLGF